jgi:hypothetical protein
VIDKISRAADDGGLNKASSALICPYTGKTYRLYRADALEPSLQQFPFDDIARRSA